jgi:2'-5' RNA ligase
MRLFVGLDVPSEMRRNLELLLHLLRPKADIQWSPMGNLHLTTKFIGEYPDGDLGQLRSALELVYRPGPLKIAIRGLGWFPNPHHPRVFFAGIDAPEGFARLAAETEQACETLGIPAENREFHPHLTLARIRRPTDLAGLRKAVAELPSQDFGAFTATAFHLYRSELRPGGSLYTKLASYPLADGTTR